MEKQLIERADLYFTEGASVKEYHAQLLEVEGGFTVEFQYGRRGSSLESGTKTAKPVAREAAKEAFDELVNEKISAGYVPRETETAAKKQLLERADLYFTEGASDKEYHAQLFEVEGGCTVEFQYGRRGSSLASGTKTAKPVDRANAKKTFDKLVKEKTSKGYTPCESGEVFTGGDNEQRLMGVFPQLLNPISDEEAATTLRAMAQGKAPKKGVQEKHDGERRSLKADVTSVVGGNRKGLSVGIPQQLADGLAGRSLILDGEIMGNRYVAFDLLELDGRDLRSLPYEARLAALEKADLPPVIEKVKTAYGKDGQALYDEIKARKGEGVVFKDMDAPWSAGRPESGGPALKNKFYATATVLVTGAHPTKRSISVGAHDAEGTLVPLGNVTVPPNQDIPVKGDLVEVRYLYAYPNGGSLYQPALLGKRTDLEPEAASVAQLKYKPDAEGTDDDDQ